MKLIVEHAFTVNLNGQLTTVPKYYFDATKNTNVINSVGQDVLDAFRKDVMNLFGIEEEYSKLKGEKKKKVDDYVSSYIVAPTIETALPDSVDELVSLIEKCQEKLNTLK